MIAYTILWLFHVLPGSANLFISVIIYLFKLFTYFLPREPCEAFAGFLSFLLPENVEGFWWTWSFIWWRNCILGCAFVRNWLSQLNCVKYTEYNGLKWIKNANKVAVTYSVDLRFKESYEEYKGHNISVLGIVTALFILKGNNYYWTRVAFWVENKHAIHQEQRTTTWELFMNLKDDMWRRFDESDLTANAFF